MFFSFGCKAISVNPTTDVASLASALLSNDLAASQDWLLDKRGNWTAFAYQIGSTPGSYGESRVANGVNEYTSIDPDGTATGGVPGWLAVPSNTSLAAVTPTHDQNGNLTTDPTARNSGDAANGPPTGQKYTYDEENRLTLVERASDNADLLQIWYDALGRRVESKDYVTAGDECATGASPVTVRHIFDGIQTIEEYQKCAGESAWTRAREILWGDRFPQPLILIDRTDLGDVASGTDEVLHYVHDVLGSIVALTNANGEVVERYSYDPYGRTIIEDTNASTGVPTAVVAQSSYGNPFGWTGQRYDPSVRLYHFLYRSYSPGLGRWVQRDPIGYVDGTNLYEALRANVVSLIDPLGRQSVAPGTQNIDWDCCPTGTTWDPDYTLVDQSVGGCVWGPRTQPIGEPLQPPTGLPWVNPLGVLPDEPPGPGNQCSNVTDTPGGYDFSFACWWHDRCIEQAAGDWSQKEGCDDIFLLDMLDICNQAYGGAENCLAWAWRYYTAVFWNGDNGFIHPPDNPTPECPAFPKATSPN